MVMEGSGRGEVSGDRRADGRTVKGRVCRRTVDKSGDGAPTDLSFVLSPSERTTFG